MQSWLLASEWKDDGHIRNLKSLSLNNNNIKMSKKVFIKVTKNNRVIALPAMQMKAKNVNENKTLYDIFKMS